MKKTLIISYTLPPSSTGSATVIANLCRQFIGDDLVVTGAKNFKINTIFDWINAPNIKYTSWRTRPFRGAGLINLLLMPLTLILTIYYYKKFNCKNIVCIYPDSNFFIMGYLCAKFTRANFYPYLHNTFADGKKRKGLIKVLFEYSERLIFKQAKEVLLISDGLKSFYLNKYGSKYNYSVIRHTFNEEIDTQYKEFNKKINAKYVMVGSINESNRDAALRLIRSIQTIDGAEVLLRSATHEMHLQSTGLYESCKIIPNLCRNELFELLNSADALLLPHGFNGKISQVEYQTIFPTKTIEYLLAGRPIIAHCPMGCFLYTFLSHYDCAFILTEIDSEIISKNIREFKDDIILQRKFVQNAKEAAKAFNAFHVSNELKKVLST